MYNNVQQNCWVYRYPLGWSWCIGSWQFCKQYQLCKRWWRRHLYIPLALRRGGSTVYHCKRTVSNNIVLNTKGTMEGEDSFFQFQWNDGDLQRRHFSPNTNHINNSVAMLILEYSPMRATIIPSAEIQFTIVFVFYITTTMVVMA